VILVDALHAAVREALAGVGPGLYGVACSGGADSMALADATIEVAGARHVVVITIDHGLSRGSEEVARAVAAWARSRGAAPVIRRVEVARSASVEAAARDARYAALREIARETGLSAILVGHTARDQAETVLMRILRGTGPAGLAAIPPHRATAGGATILRPFLAVDRLALDDYVARRELPVWDDPMNADTSLFRVRVRREILPALRQENPQLDAALVRLASSAAEWLAVIDALAAPLGRFPIACASLAGQPAAIRKRAVALALEAIDVGWDATHLDAIDEVVCRPPAGEIALDLPGGRFVRSYDVATFQTGPASAVAAELEVPEGCELRVWQPGDRMRPTRLNGRSRKLSDLYTDAKVPRASRRTARVVVRTADATILWAEHIGIAHDSVLLDGEPEKLAALPSP
jgi:tRNA(Ile)-lysidine synthase